MDWPEAYNRVVKFLPRWEIVNPDQLGVMVRFGKFKGELEPGVYFCYPYFDEIYTVTAVSQVVNLPHQSIKSKDGKTVAITCAVTFSVLNAEQAILNVDDLNEQIRCYAGNLISLRINETLFADLNIGELSNQVFSEAGSYLSDYTGIELESVNIYDLAQHKIIRLMSGTQLPSED